MYGRNKITYIDELPSLDELENQASKNRDLIERYQPTTNSTPMRITNSPYASSATMYGGDPNLKQNPQPIFLPKVNIQDEMHEKDKFYDKASQKVPSRVDGATLAMPPRGYDNMSPRGATLYNNILSSNYEDYGIDMKQAKEGEPKMSYSENQYVIPDESYIIYEEPNNKRMNPQPQQKKRRPPCKSQQQQPQRPTWNNQIPSYNPNPPPPPQHPPQHPHQFYQPPHYSPPPPIPQYYNGHNPYFNQQPHICSLISTHLTECPLCMRLYVARKQFSYKDEDKSRNVSSAIYMIIIIFLIICCIFMFKKMMNNGDPSP